MPMRRCHSWWEPAILVLLSLSTPTAAQDPDNDHSVTLLQLLGDPAPEQVAVEYGPDQNQVYKFGPNVNTGRLARDHFQSPFFRDFSLLFTIKPTSPKSGVLFAITDASQSIIYIGVKLSEVREATQDVIFYYTEPGSHESNEAASFRVKQLTNKWSKIAISVMGEAVSLYLDCELQGTVDFERSPDEMEIDKASGVFVALAGGADPENFLGFISDLKIKGSPLAARIYCEEDDDGEASGDYGSGYGRGTQTVTPPSHRLPEFPPVRPPPITVDRNVPKLDSAPSKPAEENGKWTRVSVGAEGDNLGPQWAIVCPKTLAQVNKIAKGEVASCGTLLCRAQKESSIYASSHLFSSVTYST
ncbi:collagen alpha-1(XVIII) chain-like [Cetorhinus maximus]